jgi:hypothetical protein
MGCGTEQTSLARATVNGGEASALAGNTRSHNCIFGRCHCGARPSSCKQRRWIDISTGYSSSPAESLVAPDTLGVAITSFSENPFHPPPGETFSFHGTVSGWSQSEGLAIFVIARQAM